MAKKLVLFTLLIFLITATFADIAMAARFKRQKRNAKEQRTAVVLEVINRTNYRKLATALKDTFRKYLTGGKFGGGRFRYVQDLYKNKKAANEYMGRMQAGMDEEYIDQRNRTRSRGEGGKGMAMGELKVKITLSGLSVLYNAPQTIGTYKGKKLRSAASTTIQTSGQIEVIDMETADIIKVLPATTSATKYGRNRKTFTYRDLQSVADGLSKYLIKELNRLIPLEGYVIKVNGPWGIINVGTLKGVTMEEKTQGFKKVVKGPNFVVYREEGGEELIDPETGESLGGNKQKVGLFEVRQVFPKMSKGKFTTKYGGWPPKRGDKVTTKGW